MKKLFLLLAAAMISSGAFAEGYQVNNMSAKQTGMGHVGTAMQLGSESIFFNPAATVYQKSKFDISLGFTGILSNVHFQSLPTAENDYQPGQVRAKSDNGLSTPINAYFNYKPNDRWAFGLGFYVPNGSAMKWDDNWVGAHLVQNIELKAYTVQPTVSFKICDKLSIGAGLTINWGNFELSRAPFSIATNQKIAGMVGQLPGMIDGIIQSNPGLIGKLTPEQIQAVNAAKQAAPGIAQDLKENYSDRPMMSTRLSGNANVAVGINAGFLWNITDEWSVGMTWRSRLNMKVKEGRSEMVYGKNIKEYLGMVSNIAGAFGMGDKIPPIDNIDGGSFSTELPLPTSVTWGVSFRPTPKWEFAVDLQWIGWSAYDQLVVNFAPEVGMEPIISTKNYSNTLAFRFGGQYRATDFITARMGMYVDQSPVDSNYLNPETPSMTKVSYTAGLTLRPTKHMDIDLAYCYVSTADPERTGSYPVHNSLTGGIEKFEGNYTLHANVFSIGMAFHF